MSCRRRDSDVVDQSEHEERQPADHSLRRRGRAGGPIECARPPAACTAAARIRNGYIASKTPTSDVPCRTVQTATTETTADSAGHGTGGQRPKALTAQLAAPDRDDQGHEPEHRGIRQVLLDQQGRHRQTARQRPTVATAS